MPRNLSLPIRGKSALRPLDTARPPPNPPLGSTWPAADPQDRPHPTSPILPRMLVPKNVTACSDGSRRRLIRSLEHVQVQLSLSYSRRGDLEIFLTSPMGTRSTLVAIRPLDISGQGYNNWIFMSTHYWDEDPQGLWTLGLENKGYYFNTGLCLISSQQWWWLYSHPQQPVTEGQASCHPPVTPAAAA